MVFPLYHEKSEIGDVDVILKMRTHVHSMYMMHVLYYSDVGFKWAKPWFLREKGQNGIYTQDHHMAHHAPKLKLSNLNITET